MLAHGSAWLAGRGRTKPASILPASIVPVPVVTTGFIREGMPQAW